MKSVKRERGPNWDTQEKEIFFHCVSKVKHIIEDPKKDFSSNQKKHEAWEKVTDDFNSHAQVQKREVKNLKKLWETEKAKSRKTFTSERYSRLKTGGGSYEATPDSVQNPEVEELIGKPHIVEWTNNYDSDGVAFNNILVSSNLMDNSNITDSSRNVNFGIINVETPILISEELSAEIVSNETNPAIMIDMTKTSIKECHTKPVQPEKRNNIEITASKSTKKDGILKECELRVKRQKMAIESEEKMNKLQILNQKLVMQSVVAKRFEEHKLFKLQCEKLALEIKKIKENLI